MPPGTPTGQVPRHRRVEAGRAPASPPSPCVRDAFARQPQLAAVWGRYASSGAGSRLIMEEVLQALRAAGLPDEEIPAHHHRLAVLLVAPVSSDAGIATLTREEREQGLEPFRVAVLGADLERFPALVLFAREVHPLSADRRAAFEAILASHLDRIEAAAAQGRLDGGRSRCAEMPGRGHS